MSDRLFVQATNIHQGGGRILLAALLRALAGRPDTVALLDSRMPLDEAVVRGIEIKRVAPSVMARFGAECWLSVHVQENDTVLCFGNLPPLFKLRGRTVVFVQNRYLTDNVLLRDFPPAIRLRLALERLWFSGKLSNVDEFIVQTPTMRNLLKEKVRGCVPVSVMPFVLEAKGYTREALPTKGDQNREYDFAYVASGEPHKNHRRLLDAWCLLAEEGLFPSLCLTLDEVGFAGLCGEIEAMRQRYGLNVENAGVLPHREVLELYKNVSAAIYPSTFESFGLPLIEAHQAGLPVLASELDYVRDVLDPEQTFDPESPVSIARAVKRFMGMREEVLPLLDAKAFLEKCIGKAE